LQKKKLITTILQRLENYHFQLLAKSHVKIRNNAQKLEVKHEI